MLNLVLPVLMFLSVVAIVISAYSVVTDLYLRDRAHVNQRINQEFKKRPIDLQSQLFKNLEASADTAFTGKAPNLRTKLELMIEQSGLGTTLEKIIIISTITGVVLGGIGALFGPYWWIGGITGLIGASVPFLYVRSKLKTRLAKLLTQLPDAFDLISRVLRAGQSFSHALQAVSDEFPAPISTEFGSCYEQQNMGLPAEIAFRDLARRTGLLEIKIFVLALIVQRQTGGNLAELTEKLSDLIRDRARIQGSIKSLTAEGRLQALILLALPPIMFLVLLLVNRTYALELFEYPALIAAVFACETVGALWIRKIVNFDF